MSIAAKYQREADFRTHTAYFAKLAGGRSDSYCKCRRVERVGGSAEGGRSKEKEFSHLAGWAPALNWTPLAPVKWIPRPTRTGDDVGAATVETIVAHLKNKQDELPLVLLGRITVIHGKMGAGE